MASLLSKQIYRIKNQIITKNTFDIFRLKLDKRSAILQAFQQIISINQRDQFTISSVIYTGFKERHGAMNIDKFYLVQLRLLRAR